jgi:hypothetical protein
MLGATTEVIFTARTHRVGVVLDVSPRSSHVEGGAGAAVPHTVVEEIMTALLSLMHSWADSAADSVQQSWAAPLNISVTVFAVNHAQVAAAALHASSGHAAKRSAVSQAELSRAGLLWPIWQCQFTGDSGKACDLEALVPTVLRSLKRLSETWAQRQSSDDGSLSLLLPHVLLEANRLLELQLSASMSTLFLLTDGSLMPTSSSDNLPRLVAQASLLWKEDIVLHVIAGNTLLHGSGPALACDLGFGDCLAQVCVIVCDGVCV